MVNEGNPLFHQARGMVSLTKTSGSFYKLKKKSLMPFKSKAVSHFFLIFKICLIKLLDQ